MRKWLAVYIRVDVAHRRGAVEPGNATQVAVLTDRCA